MDTSYGMSLGIRERTEIGSLNITDSVLFVELVEGKCMVCFLIVNI